MGTPRIWIPVIPILDNAINRYVAAAIPAHNVRQLLLSGVMFFALPVTPGPFPKHGRIAGKVAIIRNHIVRFGPIHEIIIDRIRRLRGPAHHGIGSWGGPGQLHRGIECILIILQANTVLAVGRPINSYRVGFAGSRSPIVNYRQTVNPKTNTVVRGDRDFISPRRLGLNEAIPFHAVIGQRHGVRRRRAAPVEVYLWINARKDKCIEVGAQVIFAIQAADLSIWSIELRDGNGLRTAQTKIYVRDGWIIPQQAVAVDGNQHWNGALSRIALLQMNRGIGVIYQTV